MKIELKWVYMARYELILRLDGALCPLTPQKAMERPTTRLMYTGPVTTKIPYTNKKPVPISTFVDLCPTRLKCRKKKIENKSITNEFA